MRLLGLVATLVLAFGCARGPGQVIVDEGPPGYHLVEGPASGPPDLEEASGATTLPSAKLGPALEKAGFRAAHSRVWQRVQDDFALVIAFEVQDDERAKELLDEMVEILEGMDAALPIPVEGLADARAFSIAAGSRSADRDVLCHSFMFAVEARVFEARGCAPRVTPLEPIRILASRQHRAATGG